MDIRKRNQVEIRAGGEAAACSISMGQWFWVGCWYWQNNWAHLSYP